MAIFDQYTSAHFSDLNASSYDNLSNMKLDLNVSTKQGQVYCE